MNSAILSTGSKVKILSRIQELFKGEGREYIISFFTCLGVFSLITSADIFISINLQYYTEAIAMGGIAILYAVLGASGINFLPKKFFLPHIAFALTAVVLFLMHFQTGYLTGIYFYFIPAALVYINASVSMSKKLLFQHFFSIVFLFVAALVVNYFFFQGTAGIIPGGILPVFRLSTSTIFSALLLRHLVVMKEYKRTVNSYEKTYGEALSQSYLDGYIVYNKETLEVTDYNRHLIQMFELPSPDNLKGIYINQVMMRYLAEDSPNKDYIMNNCTDEWQGESAFITYNKTKIYGYVKRLIFTKDDQEFCILSIRDTTEMKTAEAELQTYKESVEKAAKAKARFLSSMSHELRTPLNGIIGTSNLVLTEPNLPKTIKEHIDILRFSSEHMLGIINDILDFSKIDAGKQELKKLPFNLRECLDNLIDSFEFQFKSKNIKLTRNYPALIDNVFICSDQVKLSQVLANLLSNSLKFTLEGSVELNVSIKKSNSKRITLLFEVKDTGIGIAKDKQAEIFQGFAQVHSDDLRRRFGGTGLGLTISERLVDMFGGSLEVESEIEKGARFYFTATFETASAVTMSEKFADVNTGKDIRGIRILVVEDNEINATILKSFLSKWEIQIKEATNGIHALELLKYHKFDLVLMDLEMPEMDGYSTIKIIRETNKELPVIAFTAALLEDMEGLITNAGFNDYVLKPFRPADLKKIIQKYTERKIEY